MGDEIFGHESQIRALNHILTSGSSGFVFLTGPEGVGKTSSLLSVLDSHNLEYDKLIANKESSHVALRTSFMGGNPIVLDNFDKMTFQVQDAFLKLVEDEYSGGFSVFAILHDEGLLTRAMRSRLRYQIRFTSISKTDFNKFVEQAGSDALYERAFPGMPALYKHAKSLHDLHVLYDLISRYCSKEDITREKVPHVVLKMDSRTDRLCVSRICIQAIRDSLHEAVHPNLICAVHEFISTILNIPSANTELHWWGLVFKR